MKRAEILPAILPRDFAELRDKVELVQGFVKTIQIDVCDGQFTPEATWPYRKHDDSFERISREEEGMPGWQELNFEIDLMANKPEEHVQEWIQAGASRVILHAEAKGDIGAAIAALSGAVEIGLAFNIDTPLNLAEKHADVISSIQLMGIDSIGFQHQPFDDKVVEKVKEARAKFPSLAISVDGGVSLETAPRLIEAGAHRLIVGSAIFAADNYIDAIREFKAIAV